MLYNMLLASMVKKTFKRLSRAVKPVNYKISLKPDLTNFVFVGDEIINVEVTRETRRITLNSVEIKLLSATFESETLAVSSNDIVYNTEDETVILHFPQALPIGLGNLSISFLGTLNDKMKGFYRSKYKSKSGEDKYCAVTQFEPTDARLAFPCWDEPACKSTFEITIIAPKDKVVLSNMDVSHQKVDDNDESLQIVTFNRTPIMSTYLVAFIVGEFDFVEGKTEDGINVRVFTPVGKSDQGMFALEISLKTLPFYNKYFGISYPLPKMDLIAIPDFAAGAMENWGLVTYRETALLVDPFESSSASKQYVALVVGHELAHQWFGNLTTMEWWTDLWLNEGFASWIEYLCVDYCCPDYKIWTQFVASDFVAAQSLDALDNSHPIEVEVGHPSEIDEIFDAISYSKGAAVIRMLHDYLGEEDFKAGLNSYLNAFKYKNSRTNDLWDHLERKSSKPVKQVMSTWTKQMGFPVLTVTCEQIQSTRIIQITQKKFTADGSQDPAKQLWAVPINISTSKRNEIRTLMNDPDMVLFLDNVSPGDWVKLNPGMTGFYRTSYSADMIEVLIPAINSLPAVDRIGLENDLFALAVAGVSPTTNFLNLLAGYKEETDYTVWSDLSGNLHKLSIIIQNTNSFNAYKNFVISLCKPVATSLGWKPLEGEDHLTAMLRCLLLKRLGLAGDNEIVEESKQKFLDHVDGVQSIPADLRSAVYSTVMSVGDHKTLEQMLSLYRNTTLMEEKNRILNCLGSTEDPDLINEILNFCLSDDVRPQDTVSGIASCTGSLIGRKLTWEFTKKNWSEFTRRYDGGFILSRLVSCTTKNFATDEEFKDIKHFFDEHQVASAERVIKQSLENIQINCKWLDREKDNIVNWLLSL
ncbi:puromycin-sensitive aminopeptidase isoform X1 [Hydra vulgaris]